MTYIKRTHDTKFTSVAMSLKFNSVPMSLQFHKPAGTTKRTPRKEDDAELSFIKKELEASLERNLSLERENEQLKQEVAHLKAKISSFKAQTLERKSSLRKKLSNSIDISDAVTTHFSNMNTTQQKQTTPIHVQEESPSPKKSDSGERVVQVMNNEKLSRLPTPPPLPTNNRGMQEQWNVKKAPPPPPPPPPPPSKSAIGSANVVKRVPGVMEFYRLLTRKDSKTDTRNSIIGVQLAANTRNMIGEIENRSRYLMAIKSDVETHGDMIRHLTKEVENAAYTDISDVEVFVKWLDRKLSYLVDERAVLKHFPQWPEGKADAMREASFSYRDLTNLETEISSYTDNPKEPVTISLKRIQTLQDRLERSVHNVEKTRDSLSKKYRDYRIPWEWMLESGMIRQLKISSMNLAKEYMTRITKELQSKGCSQKEDLVLQGARFAFRVHQFAGGFDLEAMQAFEELRKEDITNYEQQHGKTQIG